MAGSLGDRRPNRFLLPGLVMLALVASACTEGAGSPDAGDQTTSAPVRELTSIATLEVAFNEDAGATRLILLVSPT
jgi:hypothetical protein